MEHRQSTCERTNTQYKKHLAIIVLKESIWIIVEVQCLVEIWAEKSTQELLDATYKNSKISGKIWDSLYMCSAIKWKSLSCMLDKSIRGPYAIVGHYVQSERWAAGRQGRGTIVLGHSTRQPGQMWVPLSLSPIEYPRKVWKRSEKCLQSYSQYQLSLTIAFPSFTPKTCCCFNFGASCFKMKHMRRVSLVKVLLD